MEFVPMQVDPSGFEPAQAVPDTVGLALTLIGSGDPDQAVDRALDLLAATAPGTAWAILERVGPSRYRSACTPGPGPATLRALADESVGRQCLLSIEPTRETGGRLHGPHWHAVHRGRPDAASGPDLVLACWTGSRLRPPQERPLTSAAELIHGALVQARRLEALQEQCSRDPLTSLLNRRGILATLERERDRARRYRRKLSVLFVDLDGFKEINDRHGHAAGDGVLQAAADRMATAVRSCDLVGRIGGDEFLVVLPDTGLQEARATARRLRRRIAGEPVVTGEASLRIGATFGAATLETGDRADDLLLRADRRMLAKKRRRRKAAAASGPGRIPPSLPASSLLREIGR